MYVVVINNIIGKRSYGPFVSKSRAEHWAKNNWMSYDIMPLYGTD